MNTYTHMNTHIHRTAGGRRWQVKKIKGYSSVDFTSISAFPASPEILKDLPHRVFMLTAQYRYPELSSFIHVHYLPGPTTI